ncbi:MAG: YitT family protein [Bacteroidales bacterium]|nr:YitT family protein [Bacteroidales bacterium]
MKEKTRIILYRVWEYLAMTAGCLLFCLAWECFIIPNNFTSGGLTGLCTIIQYATDGAVPVAYSYGIINVFLLVVALIVFGARFGIKTLYCIALTTLLFEVLPQFDFLHSVEGNFLYIPEKLVLPVVGGLMEGVGLAIIFIYGGSTGGSDIIAFVVNKYWPVSIGRMYIYMDMVIIAALLLLPGKVFADVIYGFIMMIVSATTLDAVMLGRQSTVQLLIFSDKYQEIADYINKRMDRGVTALQATGWFTKQDKQVLLVLLRKRELPEISKVIKSLDHKAFMSVTSAKGVYGEGFEEIKVGINRKSKEKKDAA